MSQKNVEVVRRWIWAFENDTDAFRDTLHPEIEWFPIEENHTPYYGVEGAMRYRNRWFDTWDEYRTDLEEVIEEGDGVVAVVHIAARGKASGVEVDIRFYAHFKVRDDKVVHIFDHRDRRPRSKPPASRSRDVAGERGGRQSLLRGVERGGHGRRS